MGCDTNKYLYNFESYEQGHERSKISLKINDAVDEEINNGIGDSSIKT
jgi:hypothetical protein